VLIAAEREVFVYERPSFSSKKLGYLRAGARVPRSDRAASHERCPGGFYRVAPAGYVCAGHGARLDEPNRVADLSTVRADRTAGLPYVYGRSRQPPPPLYTKLPDRGEQLNAEPEFQGLAPSTKAFASVMSSPVPSWLAGGQNLPTPFGYNYERGSVSMGRALSDSAFAILQVFDQGQRRFALTTDLLLVPLDRLERVQPSSFHGETLDGNGLPVAFVMGHGAFLYAGSPSTGLRPVRALGFRELVLLTGRSERHQGLVFLETRTGDYVRDDRLVRVEPPPVLPSWAHRGKSWISVSIRKQTLVAYEGERPVYVTLVSTGRDGLGDPETTHSTLRGQYLIHTKHVSVTMSSDQVGEEFDLRDVPYVQYFQDNYALHAAYWHDAFGTPRSHGCINLSPLDARWLFQWTDPAVPQLWHGAFSLREGTLIDIEP
jgi:hypothetical protein